MVDERLFVIGGQEGDFMAKPGSPIFKCSRRHEVSWLSIHHFYIHLVSKSIVLSLQHIKLFRNPSTFNYFFLEPSILSCFLDSDFSNRITS